MNANRKRLSVVAGTVAIVLAGAGAAFAYWTTTGSGTGSGTTGTATALTVTQNSTHSGLVPGGTAQPVDFTVNNPAATDVSITSVVISVSSTSNAGCTAADFTIVQPSKPSVGTPVLVAGTSSVSFTSGSGGAQATTGATLQMINRAVNQDLCKNVTVNLAYAVS
ncbi:MAG: hypothetical protein DLM59_14475 [Pseudonocardiales bacterium]|nr:MAG: hypothetical protein DLM59_14475 [Pseudonocardiales bacterium]